MYCIKCGVKLEDTQAKCPLCNTTVSHPDIKQEKKEPLYPKNKMPKTSSGRGALNGAVIILYLIPLIVCFFADLMIDGKIDWFGYVAGALIVGYVMFSLPSWFENPNPVIFTPCNFVVVAVYLLYINIITQGNWFLGFAFPLVGALCLIVTSSVVLFYYLRKGKLYILGGTFIAFGALSLFIEFLIYKNFGINFIGWSVYPLVVLFLFGGLLIYFAINKSAQEVLKRKLFF